jgi:hypothetical protein
MCSRIYDSHAVDLQFNLTTSGVFLWSTYLCNLHTIDDQHDEFLTLSLLKDFLVHLLFWMMSAPSPSPSTSIAEEGDVNTTLYPCLERRLPLGDARKADLNEYFFLE